MNARSRLIVNLGSKRSAMVRLWQANSAGARVRCMCGRRLRACRQIADMISNTFTPMMTGSEHHRSRWLCRMAVVSSTVCLVLVGAACGDSQHVRRSMLHGRLSGRVSVCPGHFVKCVNVSAIVTVLSVRGKTFGNPVAQQRTRNGRFSFVLVPGRYFPSASVVQMRLRGDHCIAGDAIVRANKDVSDEVRCYTHALVTR